MICRRSNVQDPLHRPLGRKAKTKKKTLPPAPLFNGEKEGTDIITWFGQFDDYSSILGLRDDELVSHASLCLTGRAAKEWAAIS